MSVLPTATKAASEVLGKAAVATGSTYKILYFALHGRGELTRTLIIQGGDKYEELPVDWAVQKELTPFNCLPVVYETAASGETLELAESQAIERYLARKYHLLGANAWEEHLVNRYFNSTDTAQNFFGTSVLNVQGDARVEAANTYYKETLSKWIRLHEEHLKQNGSNGHYVGNGLTLADYKTALLVDRLLLLHPKGAEAVPLSELATPNIWKVREAVHSQKHIAQWKKSERYQELDQGTLKLFKFI
ncbi:hypothetical protein BGZ93_004478 [Podila epicladia]|nr:hypothetical protein BGZ92_011339 [Podila epicladia]KAG0096476.1 hypothetical protein BGZ93_004478 [Podila epicladia]